MRSRNDIKTDLRTVSELGAIKDSANIIIIELLLDIRDLLQNPAIEITGDERKSTEEV